MAAIKPLFVSFLVIVGLSLGIGTVVAGIDDILSIEQLAKVRKLEKRRIDSINKVIGSVIAIYGEERQGGGSGVIIDPSGIALTNHHVIMGAGIKGWGGLADGNMYRWKLIGTDPGGDVSVIQMIGMDEFPFTPLADSDNVRVGDWALAMGNPFVLTEDQIPTVTLGIVSGIKRYQPGTDGVQLVYGNCIQTDSSINPGNSGGPLFNLGGRVIGINGRGSFKERGRVNVGLGYAISSNQIKNFIPDLLATKLVEHGTLDANFEDRNNKVVCSNLFEDSKLYELGVRPGDELLEFEGESIRTANQFTNLICTLPEDWPATLLLRKTDGREIAVHIRLYGLPYGKPTRPNAVPNEKDQTPEQKEQIKRKMEMVELLSAAPGTIRQEKTNHHYAQHIIGKWKSTKKEIDYSSESKIRVWNINDNISIDGKPVGTQRISIAENGQFHAVVNRAGERSEFLFQDQNLYEIKDGALRELSLVELKLCHAATQAIGIAASNQFFAMDRLGKPLLDGSDKAQQQRAYRLKWLDSDDDAYYVWLSMHDRNSNEEVQLLKAGADLDCQHDDGGITFSDWITEGDIKVARTRHQVKGLAENRLATYEMVSVQSELMTAPLFNGAVKTAPGSEEKKLP